MMPPVLSHNAENYQAKDRFCELRWEKMLLLPLTKIGAPRTIQSIETGASLLNL